MNLKKMIPKNKRAELGKYFIVGDCNKNSTNPKPNPNPNPTPIPPTTVKTEPPILTAPPPKPEENPKKV